MGTDYIEIPHNMEELAPYAVTSREKAVTEILGKEKCYFYDACSFRRHANLEPNEAEYLLRYIKSQNGIISITRCILMELASHSGVLCQEYVAYAKHINEYGIVFLIIYEEDLFSVLEAVFSANVVINNYLCWAVRMVKSPVSTIAETLWQNRELQDEVIKGRNLGQRDVYKHFFEAVRGRKEAGDNLGEELLAVCLHILSHIPGEKDGKFCVITDDKGAAGKIDALFKKTARQHRGKKIIIFSTPKLVQVLYRENILLDKEHIKTILNSGINGNVAVLGTRIFDIQNREISITSEELAELIMQPNGINIVF